MGEKVQVCRLPDSRQREKLDQNQIPAELTLSQMAVAICEFLKTHGVEPEGEVFSMKVPNGIDQTKVNISKQGIDFQGVLNESVMTNLAKYAVSCIETLVVHNVCARIGKGSERNRQTIVPVEAMLPVARGAR